MVKPATYHAEVEYSDTNLIFRHTVWLWEREEGKAYGSVVGSRSYRTREKALQKAKEWVEKARAWNAQAVTVTVR